MPNTEVKLTNAESTWPEAAREDRKLLIKEKTLTNVGVFFHMPGLPICMHKFEGSRTKVSGRIRERCHPSHRFFTLCHMSIFPSFPQSILVSVQNDRGMEVIIIRGDVNRHLARQRRICCCGGENGKKIKAISCELSAAS